jgi:hypothetical protein
MNAFFPIGNSKPSLEFRGRFLPFRFHLMDTITPTAPTLPQVVSVNASIASQLAEKRNELKALSLPLAPNARSSSQLSDISDLSDEIRRFDNSQVGAFTTFRKPD